MNNEVLTICGESLNVFKNIEMAKDFYKICYMYSEGFERERYANVLLKLDYYDVVDDEATSYCDSISIQLDKNNFINYDVEHLSISETIDNYKEKLKPVLEVSKEYNINFLSKIPFEDFGSDDSSLTTRSFSNYYKDLLNKFNIKIEKINTDEVSDGKYKMNINDSVIVDIKSWDDFETVINNINSIIDLLKDNNLKIEDNKGELELYD